MSGFNLRILAERLVELEKRVAKLESSPSRYEYKDGLVDARDMPFTPVTGLFTLSQHGRWWYCVSPDGVKVNDTGLSKEDAQKLADDMNGVTKAMCPYPLEEMQAEEAKANKPA